MNNQKVIVEKGRTIINENKRNINKITTLQAPNNINYNTPVNNENTNNYNNFNLNNLTTLIPLLKGLGANDNNMNFNKILELLPNLNNQQNSNMFTQLLPLIQSLNTKNEDKQKISSFTRTDE